MSTALSKPSFRACRLYSIVDRLVCGDRDPVQVALAAIRGGVDLIQWRDKHSCDRTFLEVARRLREVTARFSIPFIINDRIAIAQLIGAEGVHLGHEDISVPEARRLVGDSMLIGRSTHSLEEALQAQQDGADYLGIGPVFSTPTKPDYAAVGLKLVQEASRLLTLPWVAIGGIDPARVPLVLSAGANRIAVVRAIAGDLDPETAAKKLKTLLTQ